MSVRNPLVRVKRIDDGKGKKDFFQQHWDGQRWVPGVPEAMRSRIPIYRYTEVQTAIANGEPIFWVEGESCADALWELGLAATTSIGGSSGYRRYGSYAHDLKGAMLVLCPDMDTQGLKYAEQVAADFGIDAWVYPFPESVTWDALPTKQGLDIADWIAAGATVDDIMKAIGSKRAPISLHVPDCAASEIDFEAVKQQLLRLIGEEPTDSQRLIEQVKLAKQYPEIGAFIKPFHQALEKESEVATATCEAARDLDPLKAIREQPLDIEAGLYGDEGRLAYLIRQVAEAMPTAPEFLVTTLIPVLGSRIGTKSRLIISKTAKYSAVSIFRTLIVAKTGHKKTPAQMAILSVLEKLEEIYYSTYQLHLEDYHQELSQWEAIPRSERADEPKPTPPIRKRYMSTDDTLAARAQIHAENPTGFLLYRDEASAFITERGRFTTGRGDGGETEADLSEFNGKSLSRDRKQEGSIFLPHTAINRTGAIQFSKLQQLMGAHTDDCGEFARYLFCAADAPPSYIDLTKDVGDSGLDRLLIDLIERLDELPEQDYELSAQAKAAFAQYQHELTDRAISTDHPAMEAAYPKFETYFARFILWIHIVNGMLARRLPDAIVSGQTVERARLWTEYFVGQFQLILAMNSPQQGLTGDLLKVYQYLQRKQKPLTLRQIVQARIFDRARDKTKTKTPYISGLLNTLVEKGWLVMQQGSFAVAGVANCSTVE
ncbi:MAG: DUF3987 domain-containing protein [Leptolyngbya sp. SIO4C1]|nr:DUF3987 domain-containing protein [Leptolyngbya sp. SIO4C1]